MLKHLVFYTYFHITFDNMQIEKYDYIGYSFQGESLPKDTRFVLLCQKIVEK